ncbi:MAG: CTP synthase, partial [Candidatus Kerfeldbacteria bacterium]|nr:CTP synthase [Candidatus Kerfeldbacteria bacterium]
TTGRVFLSVIQRERNLAYGGKCVEVVPHIPMEVIDRIRRAAAKAKAEIMIIEIGGTVGEYQNILFLEAARQMHYQQPDDVLFLLVSYLPVPGTLGEMKTKPTQYAVRQVNEAGIQPDFIVARSSAPLDTPRKKKLSIFCNVSEADVIAAPDVESIYEVPLDYEREHFSDKILAKLQLRPKRRDLNEWRRMVQRRRRARRSVRVGIVGKYFATGDFILPDAYISVIEAIRHAATSLGVRASVDWINSDEYEAHPEKLRELAGYGGIIVPGGFGTRGVEGKIMAIRYAREHALPFFGLCYGMQLATVEFARHVVGLKGASSTEIDPKTPHPLIHIMPDQAEKLAKQQYGNTMRLGNYPCKLTPGSSAAKLYRSRKIVERHRHRYEVNNDYRERLTKKGLLLSGLSPDKKLVEIVELPGHPFFLGTQFHPEFTSRPLRPHPLFVGFLSAALKRHKKLGSAS